MPDELRELVRHALAGAIPENDQQALIREIVDEGVRLERSKGGVARAKQAREQAANRRLFIMMAITKLPVANQRQLLSDKTVDMLLPIVVERYRIKRGTLVKDLQAIKRDRRKK